MQALEQIVVVSHNKMPAGGQELVLSRVRAGISAVFLAFPQVNTATAVSNIRNLSKTVRKGNCASQPVLGVLLPHRSHWPELVTWSLPAAR